LEGEYEGVISSVKVVLSTNLCTSQRGRQTTVRWQKQVFIHTRLLRAYLALARLSCLYLRYRSRAVTIDYLMMYAKLSVYVTSEVR